MIRSPFAALTLLCLAIVMPTTAVVTADDRRPNILLIVSEDNGPEISCYGDPYAKTPHLDRLAEQGILFRNAYVPQAGCSQSRASFLTGLYPHQHGQFGLATWGFHLYDAATPNLPRSLKGSGYRTGIIGKLHINPASAFPFDFQEISSANFARKNLDQYALHAKSFITKSDQPFFLSMNYPEAHDPWIAQVDGIPKHPQTADHVLSMPYMGIDPPGLREMVADYYNCMSRLDTLIGNLLKVLDDSGKAKNTIVIYIGDHGADMLRGKRTCFEGGLRIPMIIRWPAKVVPQSREDLVSTIDLMPTLLTITKSTPVVGLPGRSLVPLFKPGQSDWRTHLYAEYHTHAAAPNFFPQRCVRDGRYKLIESLLPNTLHPDYKNTLTKLHRDYERREAPNTLNLMSAIKNAPPTVKQAYALMRKPPRYQLYDLQQDPYEFENLAETQEHTETLNRLRAKLTQWRKDTQDPLLNDEALRQLTQEVQGISNKSSARKHKWRYPTYLSHPSVNK